MYKISVPVNNDAVWRFGKEKTLKQLRRFDAERVFISIESYSPDEDVRKTQLERLAENAAFFRENGFEVGAWIWTFMFDRDAPFTCMTGLLGERYRTFACPSDGGFVDFASRYISDIARCGVDLIMFDDDFRYGFFGASPACLCENHMKMINETTGDPLDRPALREKILTGGKNKYRDAYIKANGDVFRAFARRMREAVDSVDPSIRLGFCTCMTGWDVDGVDAAEISEILAGNTRPFVRLIGAPYWAVKQNWGHLLADTVEMERMESVWTDNGEIEIMAEGDVYPRPRVNCPASFLELYDTAIRASRCTDGILKYGIDYTCDPETETGYARMHEKNRKTYEFIDKNFIGEQLGVRVYRPMKLFSDCVPDGDGFDPQNLVFPMASRSLSYCSIPTVYSGEGQVTAIFGENARHCPLPLGGPGAILDITAAAILTGRGVDCGLISCGERKNVTNECFDDGEPLCVTGAVCLDIKVSDGAAILSRADGGCALSYLYENGDGKRFLVLNVLPEQSAPTVMRHGRRSRQYADAVEWISGRRLPFYIPDCPALYVMCQRDGGRLVAGMWNMFPDPALDPVARLAEEYKTAEFYNCAGRLEKDRLILSDLPPFSFSAVILQK